MLRLGSPEPVAELEESCDDVSMAKPEGTSRATFEDDMIGNGIPSDPVDELEPLSATRAKADEEWTAEIESLLTSLDEEPELREKVCDELLCEAKAEDDADLSGMTGGL